MAKSLITGVAGFAGRHIVEILSKTGEEIVGCGLKIDGLLEGDSLWKGVDLRQLDVRDESQIVDVLSDTRPDVIYHMAAVVPIAIALETPSLPLETNVIGTANLFQAIRKVGLDPCVVMGGSSEEYGLILPDEVPVNEDQPLRPKRLANLFEHLCLPTR